MRQTRNAAEPNSLSVCLTVMQGNWHNVADVAKAADVNGLHSFGVADTPMLERDVYLACAAAALNTESVSIVTGVTNPVTRHPSVTAAAFLQLHELAPGRVICGISTGDSAVWGVGLKPAKIEELREYILAVKALLRGDPASWHGNTFAAQWRHFEPFDLPVYVACAGPKSMRMAAQVADGLILSVGVSDDDLRWARTQIVDACREVGRDPNEVDVWHYTEIIFANSASIAAQEGLGSFSHWLTLGGTVGKRIPPEYLPALAQLNTDSKDVEATYATEDRGRTMVKRAKKLGVYDWLTSRSPCLWGTPRDIGQRLDFLRGRGVTKWMLYPGSRYRDDTQVATMLGETLKTTDSKSQA